MAINNARPTLWSKMILRALNTLLVFNGPEVISRDYEGEIQEAGDSVKIVSLADVKVQKYTKDTDLTGPEALTDAAQTLVIDQQDAFNFEVDNIDRVQANVNLMEEASRRAAYALRKAADEFTAKKHSECELSTAEIKRSTAEAVYNAIVEAGVKLDETDTPDDGRRFIVLPPAAIGNLQKDIRFVGYGTQANLSRLEKGIGPGANPGFGYANGLVGEAAGFKVFQSNQIIKESSKWKSIAGHPIGWTFAQQIVKTVAYEPPLRFSEAVKGLHVYGGKVVRPAQLCLVKIEDA